MPRPNALFELAPMGIRLIASTPHAMATLTTPAATSDAARLVACCDDPHWVSTVVAGVLSGSPAASHAVRVTLKLCSPTWLTQPPTTCPTSAGSMPVRATSSLWTRPSKAAGWSDDSPPLRLPTGVRTASTTTTDRPDIGELMLVDGNGA